MTCDEPTMVQIKVVVVHNSFFVVVLWSNLVSPVSPLIVDGLLREHSKGYIYQTETLQLCILTALISAVAPKQSSVFLYWKVQSHP